MAYMYFKSMLLLLLLSCNSHFDIYAQYNLSKPDQKIILPPILNEISGLTEIDSCTFACIQDEKGILFIYDLNQNKIKYQNSFHLDGDYEGIARVDSSIYILRSDGDLFHISDYTSKNFQSKVHKTGIPANNNEGLCFDAKNNRLLIACKGKISKGPGNKDKRAIYGFDLRTNTLSKEPVFEFDLQQIKNFAKNNNIELPVKSKKKGQVEEPLIKFMTSAIAVHPVNKKLYLLSASDHLFFIFKMDGTLEYMQSLDENIFNKAEGITFLQNGDMLITNEAQDKMPTLLKFKYPQNWK